MAHPARQVFQHIIDSDAESSDAWLPAAFSRLQGDDLGVVHSPIIAGLTRAVALWDGSAPVFPGEVNVVDGFAVAAIAWLLVYNPFHATDILPCDRDEKLRSRSNSRTFRSRISNPQPNPQKVCLI